MKNIKRTFVLTMQNPRTKDRVTRTVYAYSVQDAQRRARVGAPNFSVCVGCKEDVAVGAA